MVVEGCGSNGCEYMTGGVAVILGAVGNNFAAGMTGGMAFVYDPRQKFQDRVNPDTVIWQRVETEYWHDTLQALVEAHFRETQSRFAEQLLADWPSEVARFWQVVPKEMLDKLEQPIIVDAEDEMRA